LCAIRTHFHQRERWCSTFVFRQALECWFSICVFLVFSGSWTLNYIALRFVADFVMSCGTRWSHNGWRCRRRKFHDVVVGWISLYALQWRLTRFRVLLLGARYSICFKRVRGERGRYCLALSDRTWTKNIRVKLDLLYIIYYI